MNATRFAAAAAIGLSLAISSPIPAGADEPPPVAIVHAHVVVPGSHPPLDDVTVVLSGGKVQAVGAAVKVPPAARIVDAKGKTVTPGFIDADDDVGVIDVELEPSTNDADAHAALNADLRMGDAYNPRSLVVPITRSAGVTSVVVAPRAGLLAGHDDARFYGAHRAQYDANASRLLGLPRLSLEALQPVVRGAMPLVVTAHRASDIEATLRLADEQKLRVVIRGGSEAWMLADDLARRKVPVILDPLEDLPSRFDRLHARSDNAAILSRAGVTVVIATFASHQVRRLWQHAGNAVRLGMDHDAALRAVTEAPAAAFDLKGYGRIEPGAVANVVVWSGDPLQTIQLGDVAPDFTQDSTEGPIHFHDWLGKSWGILFSHPKDFTPVCTTELGAVAKLRGEFEKRNVKPIAVSVDDVASHKKWTSDIEETQRTKLNYPILGDPDRKVSNLYGMIHPNANDTLTVRSVFVIDPNKKVRLTITYPASTGRNFDEILRVVDSLQLTDSHSVATPANWKDGEEVIIVPSLQDPEVLKSKFPKGYKVVKPYLRTTPQPNK